MDSHTTGHLTDLYSKVKGFSQIFCMQTKSVYELTCCHPLHCVTT